MVWRDFLLPFHEYNLSMIVFGLYEIPSVGAIMLVCLLCEFYAIVLYTSGRFELGFQAVWVLVNGCSFVYAVTFPELFVLVLLQDLSSLWNATMVLLLRLVQIFIVLSLIIFGNFRCCSHT